MIFVAAQNAAGRGSVTAWSRGLLVVLLLLPMAPAAGADLWLGRLADGRPVVVDPNTRRPTVVGEEGRRTQLWDGIHTLESGDKLRVRSGVMVPDAQLLRRQEGRLGDRHAPADPAPCRALVLRVCGLHDECADTEACRLARQLAEPVTGSADAWTTTDARRQCRAAAADEALFPRCAERARGAEPSPCEILADTVCGQARECADAPACPPARQLAEMEYDERVASGRPLAPTPASRQCTRALESPEGGDFFTPCRP